MDINTRHVAQTSAKVLSGKKPAKPSVRVPKAESSQSVPGDVAQISSPAEQTPSSKPSFQTPKNVGPESQETIRPRETVAGFDQGSWVSTSSGSAHVDSNGLLFMEEPQTRYFTPEEDIKNSLGAFSRVLDRSLVLNTPLEMERFESAPGTKVLLSTQRGLLELGEVTATPGLLMQSGGNNFSSAMGLVDAKESAHGKKELLELTSSASSDDVDVANSLVGSRARDGAYQYAGDVDMTENVLVRQNPGKDPMEVATTAILDGIKKAEKNGFKLSAIQVQDTKYQVNDGKISKLPGWGQEPVAHFSGMNDEFARELTQELKDQPLHDFFKVDLVGEVDGAYQDVTKVIRLAEETPEGRVIPHFTQKVAEPERVFTSEKDGAVARKVADSIPEPEQGYAELMRGEAGRYKENPMKMAKRLYNSLVAEGEMEQADTLSPLFRSPIARAAQVGAEMGTLAGSMTQTLTGENSVLGDKQVQLRNRMVSDSQGEVLPESAEIQSEIIAKESQNIDNWVAKKLSHTFTASQSIKQLLDTAGLSQ